jgi:hypothetical protein
MAGKQGSTAITGGTRTPGARLRRDRLMLPETRQAARLPIGWAQAAGPQALRQRSPPPFGHGARLLAALAAGNGTSPAKHGPDDSAAQDEEPRA